MGWKQSIMSFAAQAIANAPSTASDLKQTGQKMVEAGELVGSLVDPEGPIQKTYRAVRERRVTLDIADGRIGLKIVEPRAVAHEGRVKF